MKYDTNKVLDETLREGIGQARTIGIDIGSRAAKAVLLYDGALYTAIQPSGISSIETAKQMMKALVKEADISAEQIQYIVGTGYGRVAMDFGEIPFKGLTEITCHALGAHYLDAETRTIIDIGGQDSKAIKVDPENGNVLDFIMNDKCAAGTGRFLEKVAQLLDLSLEELGEYAVRADAPAEISSQCVVFAESEVISLKVQGISKENIAAGIHFATARRIKSLLRRVGFEQDIVFTGGVSQNLGMVKALEETIGAPITQTALDPTYAGALGAAVSAAELALEVTESYGGGL
ncbi:MAG: acyl-CoA dehydratase activase [Clostridia bacterium]|nr:acyl-CoA dehydratase activase [Clostridia bacterium]